ncbi:DUF4124 domain-containing protein [Rehaibacterium terrae]|uniref:DUF4124 domain-containing protein n=1 Tax=Rehaibacterium terrae TaxID=1341696 RepID=A0A7W7XYI0_9GAMM|nr:DUF4124 domain-containing protein [Rehaibacterium terrae]MBB5014765.1 hypothetical protein [Rehaibacterium terrae]
MLLAGVWLFAQAQPVTVYRCVDDEGLVSLQDQPCPSGQRQERRELERPLEPARPPPTSLVPPVPPPAEPGPAPAPAPPPEPQAALSPPPLWECQTWDGKTYDSETGETIPRCVPLAVLGWDMRGLPPEQAAACQWVRDTCRRLDDAAACARWRFLRAEAERDLRFAFSDTRAQAEAEFARRVDIVARYCR